MPKQTVHYLMPYYVSLKLHPHHTKKKKKILIS